MGETVLLVADETATLRNCIAAGACDYFITPFENPDCVMEVVTSALKRIARWRRVMQLEIREPFNA